MTATDTVQDKDTIVLSIPFSRIPDIEPLLKSVLAQAMVIDTSR